jgi:hypothetical protein
MIRVWKNQISDKNKHCLFSYSNITQLGSQNIF